MSFKFLVFVGILGALVPTNGLRLAAFEDCVEGDKMVDINYAEISPCTKEPCSVYQGKNVTIEVNFETLQDAEMLTASIFVSMNGEKMPYQVSMPDACKDRGLTCPLSAGNTYTYKESITVPKYVRKWQWTLGLKLTNEDDKEYLCLMETIEIK